MCIQENAFENVVWKMATILSRPQCVKRPLFEASMTQFTDAYMHYQGSVCKHTEDETKWPPDQGTFSNAFFLLDDCFILISLKIVPKVLIDNKPVLVQIMARYWAGDRPLS